MGVAMLATVSAQAAVYLTEVSTKVGTPFAELYNASDTSAETRKWRMQCGLWSTPLPDTIHAGELSVIDIPANALMGDTLLLKNADGSVVDFVALDELTKCNNAESLQRDTVAVDSDGNILHEFSPFRHGIATKGTADFIEQDRSVVAFKKADGRNAVESVFGTRSVSSISRSHNPNAGFGSLGEGGFRADAHPKVTSDRIVLTCEETGECVYEVQNLQGSTLLSGRFEQESKVSVANLPKGFYNILIANGKSSKTIKIEKK